MERLETKIRGVVLRDIYDQHDDLNHVAEFIP